MPAEGRNTKRFYEFEGGYKLPSGKILTKEDVSRISKEAGLPTSEGMSIDEQLESEPRECPITGGIARIRVNPYYTAWVDHNPPTPPMLQFFSSCTFNLPNSAYTINLNTLRPTKNSPIQIEIPKDIKAMLR